MSKMTISLSPGAVIGWMQDNWIITEQDSFERLLVERVSDGRREFVPISEVSLPTHGSTAAPERRTPTLTSQSPDEPLRSTTRIQNLYVDLLALTKLPKRDKAQAIRELCEKHSLSRTTVYDKLRALRSQDRVEVLYRRARKQGVGLGVRLGDETLAIIRQRLRQSYFVAEKRSIPDVLELVNGDLRAKGLKEVSRVTVYRVAKQVTHKETLEAQGRKKQAKDLFRPKVGHLPDADYPLAVVQVDHTPCQVCLVDQESRQPIGDAQLTLVIDCYSRMVLGFQISLDPPSTLGTGLALANAILPKTLFLQRVGVKGDWPCWGFPDVILVDNAAELNGKMMKTAGNQHRFTIRNRPIGSPNFGGHVESAFKTFMYELKSIPGTKFSNPTERAEYDSEGNAILTLREFEHYFTEFLVNDYHLAEHSGEGMRRRTPLQVWRAGVFEGDKFPPVGLPDLPADPDEIELSLRPVDWRTIQGSTVSMFDIPYYSRALETMSDKVDMTKPTEQRLVEVRYDPRDISKIWVKDSGPNGGYLETTFADLSLPAISLWELRARRRALGRPSDEFKQQRYESKERGELLKKSKAAQTKQARRLAEKEKLDAQARLLMASAPVRKAQPKQSVPRPSIDQVKAGIRERLQAQMAKRGDS